MPADQRQRLPRRRLLQGLGAGVAASAAGCLGDDDDDADDGDDDADDGDDFVTDDDDDDDFDLGDIQEGGRLEFAIERESIDDYDQAHSSLADDSTVFEAVYDGLRRTDQEGNYYNWMAEEYDTTDAQDVGEDDYADYMEEYEIASVDDGFPLFDLEWPNLVLMRHPDDMEAVEAGDLGEGDDMRVLTREEAAEAAEDGTYGTRVEGRLREGIEFHNGEELTAGNVVGSYDRFVGSNNEGQVFDSVLHAEAPDGEDGYEFILYAQQADAIAEAALPPFQIYPSEHLDVQPGDLDPRDGGPVPVGTGPYEVAEFDEGTQLLLEKTDNYWVEDLGLDSFDWWDGPEEFPEGPVFDEINIRFVPDEGQRVAALQDGSIDVAYQLPAGDRSAFDDDENYSVNAAVSTGFKFMQFSLTDTDEGGAFAHQDVRQAVNHLIPRQDIVDIVAEGWGAPGEAPIPAPAAGLGSHMSYEEMTEQDWAYPADPDVDAAEQYIEDSPLEPPIDMVVETNADDEERQDKMALAVDELSDSGLFDATLETPADIGDWTTQHLYVADSHESYAERNAVAVIGLAAGFDPHPYPDAIHHPGRHNICCNFFHGPDTFDFIELMDSCRFGVDVAEDPDLRRDRFDELWPQVAEALGNIMIDFSLETNVSGPDVRGYAGYPDRRAFLTYSIWAPFDEVVSWLDR